MNILGLYGAFDWEANKFWHPIKPNQTTWVHDAGASLFQNGKHICSISEERLTRIKYDGNYPIESIKYCLIEAGLTGNDIDIVCIPSQAVQIFYEQLDTKVIDNILLGMFPNAEIKIISHHVCHAASSVFTSNFDEGSIVTLDGAGSLAFDLNYQEFNLENNTIGYFNKKERTFNLFVGGKYVNRFGDYYHRYSFDIYCKKNNIPESMWDSIIPESVDGKVMGLSAYGTVAELEKYKTSDETWGGVPYVLFDIMNRKLKGTEEDIAASMQKTFEDALVYYIKQLNIRGYLKDNVCFAGGVFLNVLANTELKRIINNMHIPPYTNDTGLAFGAAAYTAFKLGYDIEMPDNIAFLGKLYSDSKIENALQTYNLKYDVYDPKDVAVHLMDNKIIAWFQNRSEGGPRALGARSILMSAKHKDNKDILNSRVKHREYWRPFAGIILDHKLSEYFDDSFETPYMLYSLIVKEEKREEIPAITHKDNSCRIQTVNDTYNKEVTKLIEEYYKLSGTPVILNTSFNDNGEPIVETPEHAIEAFLNMDIDYLVIGNYIVNKKDIK